MTRIENLEIALMIAMQLMVVMPASRQSREIWLSNLDGSRMHRLGELTFDINDFSLKYGGLFASSHDLVGLQWAPDGKHISYMYDQKLYLVAVQ